MIGAGHGDGGGHRQVPAAAGATCERPWLWSRRRLLGGATVLGAGLALSPFRTFAAEAVSAAAPAQADPVTHLLRAYVSTLVPGPADDPEGTPGAVEAEAVEQLEAQVPYVLPFIVSDVTAAALAAHAKPFAELDYPDREALLVEAFADPSRSPYHLIALAVGAGTFYGDFRNRVGGEHLGFAGPSDGYVATYTDRTGYGQPQADAVPP